MRILNVEQCQARGRNSLAGKIRLAQCQARGRNTLAGKIRLAQCQARGRNSLAGEIRLAQCQARGRNSLAGEIRPPRAWHYLLSLLLFIITSTTALAFAQTAEPWTVPLNLSHSGAASVPQLVVGSSGAAHVLWQDEIDGYFYTRQDDDTWTTPVSVETPFATRRYFFDLQPESATPLFAPTLFADDVGAIHAFWRSTYADDAGRLYYSRVDEESFANFASWSERQQLSESGLVVAMAVGNNGRLHLAYIRDKDTAQDPAGLYYRSSDDNGDTWSAARNLYPSGYYRLASPEEAQVDIAAAGDTVMIGWDDQSLDRVFSIQSDDNGGSWSEVETVDQRQEDDNAAVAGPQMMQVSSAGETWHRVWQAGHEGASCSLYHQWSPDGGQSWQPPQLVFDNQGCPEANQLLVSDDHLFLLSTFASGRTLTVWHDSLWLEPENQPSLTSFIDPETFKSVSLTCGEAAATAGSQLLVVSCGQSSVRDVWYTSRTLASFIAELTVTPVWQTPAALAVNAEEAPLIFDPVLVADPQNRFHLLWAQAAAPAGNAYAERGGEAIFYAQWQGTQWTRPTQILQSPQGKTEQPAVAYAPDGRLHAVWSGGDSGQIYTSWASADRAAIASEWVEPVALPMPIFTGRSADILIGRDGIIYVAYVVPFNEARGLYLVKSSDNGENWSEPIQVFDGVAAGWDEVAAPQLALTEGNYLHLLWQERPLPGSAAPARLFYARSEDGGATWTPGEEVKNDTAQAGSVVSSQIVGIGSLLLQRIWQAWDGTRLNLWHEFSSDNGLTWSRASRIGGFGEAGAASLVSDGAGRIYLLQLATDGTTQATTLKQWQWRNERWQETEALPLSTMSAGLSQLVAAVAADGRLTAVYTAASTQQLPDRFYTTGRSLPLPAITVTPLPTLTPTPLPTTTASPTPLPQPSATPVFPLATNSEQTVSLPGGPVLELGGWRAATIAGLPGGFVIAATLALLSTGLLIMSAFIYRWRSKRGR